MCPRSVLRAGRRSSAWWAAAVSRQSPALSRARTSAMRTQVVSCGLPRDPVTTRTPGRDRELVCCFTPARLIARAAARAVRLLRMLPHAQCICRAGIVVDCARDCACRPPLAVETRNFLSRPTVKNLCRDKDFSIITESQNYLSRQRTRNGQ